MENLNDTEYLEVLGRNAKEAAHSLKKTNLKELDNLLIYIASAMLLGTEEIIEANKIDMENAEKKGMNEGLKDRLRLNEKRINAMAEGLIQVSELENPVGKVLETFERPNGLIVRKVSEPIGVIGMIYEARPNVTSDAFGLCFKTGNAVILKGGSDAFHSNNAIVKVIRDAITEYNAKYNTCVDPNVVQVIERTDRSVTTLFMHLNKYVDVLIPRGSAGLIQSVIKESTIPVIETGAGNCHVFVDKTADFTMAINIIENAKTSRVGVCNAIESILIHEDIADEFVPLMCKKLGEKNVEVRLEPKLLPLYDKGVEATEEDYATEYLDYIVSVKSVSGIDEAIAHINKYNTGHSECIVTKDSENIEKFMNEVEAACVYSNASTRFTDGFEFGFGAEIGISTQKLHARGPMGLTALTSYKYRVTGNGQVRN